MYRLENNDYCKVSKLVQSENELSVYSVIKGIMPGEIYVNDLNNPVAALIKTCECNLIAGAVKDALFNSEVSEELDLWDQLTPDTSEWIDIIPTIHKNPFIRKYKRRHYILSAENFKEYKAPLKEGFVLEKVDIGELRKKSYENTEKLLEWAANWGEDDNFQKYGTGYYIHNDKIIVSWSLSDCYLDKRIAIGIHTDEKYRKHGFGRIVASATVKSCFAKGYEEINWLCMDKNKGSVAIAEKLGFTYSNSYFSFSSYPPIENLEDLTEAEWHEWGEYLEDAAASVENLIWESLYCYLKSNDVGKTMHVMTYMEQKKIALDYSGFKNYVIYLQEYGRCSNFKNNVWSEFLTKKLGKEKI
jgi:RimJ/RimL family protein N-acetyltransferase